MKFSTETNSLLNNFAAINTNMLFKAGNKIRTMSEARNVFAEADITETIPTEFAIYDLKEFLSVVSLVENGELDVASDGSTVTVSNDIQNLTYFTTAIENVTAPPEKEIKMPTPEVTFVLSAEQINAIRKASSVLGHANVSIVGKNGKITLSVYDKNNSTSNKFDIVVDTANECTDAFEFVLIIGNLKLVPGDYNVELSSKLITKFTNTTSAVRYWIAAEKSSTFGE